MMQIELNSLVYCRTFKQQLICILIMHPTVRHTQFAYDEPELPNCAPGCRKSFKYQPQITTIKTNVLKNLLNAAHTHTHTENIHTRTHTLSACRPIKRFQNKPNKCQRAQKVADSTTICYYSLLLLNVAINAREEVKQIDIRIIIILLKCSRVVAP